MAGAGVEANLTIGPVPPKPGVLPMLMPMGTGRAGAKYADGLLNGRIDGDDLIDTIVMGAGIR